LDFAWQLDGVPVLRPRTDVSVHGIRTLGKARGDLIAMVPRVFPRPDLMVSATGVCEILGGLGLLIPAVAPVAAACLALLLMGLFPANIRAAREHLTIGGRPATVLPLRALLQLVFITAVLAAGFPGAFPLVAR
jgi:uncharacterized membrane protein